ncbi:MAG: Type secretion system protein subtype b [Deltaproteobacteria bacterium]|jgi:Tfp pilus assembly protein PilO|nr:Type secretion system protein subtype b [Deltaproteobacteria bacterium]
MKPIYRKSSWGKLKGRKKNLLLFLMAAVLVVVIYEFGVVALVESQRKVRDELALKGKMLGRYDEFVKMEKDIEQELGQVEGQVEAIQAKLLPGETPQIMAASLQEMLKKTSEKNGIQIRSFRIGEPKELNFFLRVPVIIEINPTKSMSSLTYFLYDIENGEKLLVISDLNLTAPNMRNPTEVQGNLTVTGFARNNQPKGKAKEG